MTTQQPQPQPAPESIPDTRRPAYGAGRALIAVYGVFAISATARAAVQLGRNAAEAHGACGLSAFSAAGSIVATVAMADNGHKMGRGAGTSVGTEGVGVADGGIGGV